MAKDTTVEMEEQYEVEDVVDDRIRHGKKEYYIKWKNYPPEQNTWEPEEHLNCRELIEEYESDKVKKNAGKETTIKKKEVKKLSSTIPRKLAPGKRNSTASSLNTSNSSAKRLKRLITNGNESKADDQKVVGFARNLKPSEIIGATEQDDELKFLIKWEGTTDTDMVPAKEANLKCPQLVIDFYEERLTWHNIPEGSRLKK